MREKKMKQRQDKTFLETVKRESDYAGAEAIDLASFDTSFEHCIALSYIRKAQAAGLCEFNQFSNNRISSVRRRVRSVYLLTSSDTPHCQHEIPLPRHSRRYCGGWSFSDSTYECLKQGLHRVSPFFRGWVCGFFGRPVLSIKRFALVQGRGI